MKKTLLCVLVTWLRHPHCTDARNEANGTLEGLKLRTGGWWGSRSSRRRSFDVASSFTAWVRAFEIQGGDTAPIPVFETVPELVNMVYNTRRSEMEKMW